MPVLDNNARQWGMACHLAGFAHYMFPFGGIFGPLVVWLSKKDQWAFVDGQGREAINFHLTMLIFELISIVLMIVLIGFFMLLALELFKVIVMVIAIVK